jgi:hypothetical protein
MLIKKRIISSVIAIEVIGLISACSQSSSESQLQTDKSVVTTTSTIDTSPGGLVVPPSSLARNPLIGEQTTQVLNLSPGKLPGAGVAQPGLMPGHVTLSPK